MLTGIFGLDRLELAEDVVQEALARALKIWPFYGVPDNPAAWLTQTAKNLALDAIRREANLKRKQNDIVESGERWSAHIERDFTANEIEDARLRLMFVCCHPVLPEEAQTALALKTLCGFGVHEIANAFLTTEAAIAKRLTRAKHRLKEGQVALELPHGEDLSDRLDGVLKTIYLLFNEGYKASSGEDLIRKELCAEAIRLGALVARHPAGNMPTTHALLALMLFNGARLSTRVDHEGHILRLRDQDRSQWDRVMISRGMWHLAYSGQGTNLSSTHFQAAIAAFHCAAETYESTDWPQILKLYDRLLEVEDSPVVALNRACVVRQIEGPAAGLRAVELINNQKALGSYYLFYAVLAEFQSELQDHKDAARNLCRAIELTSLKSEKLLLREKLARCEDAIATRSGPDTAQPLEAIGKN